MGGVYGNSDHASCAWYTARQREQPCSAVSLYVLSPHLEQTQFMIATCPSCRATALSTDKFCPSCGHRLTLSAWTEDDYIPLPGVIGPPDLRIHKKRRRTRQWYRRPMAMMLTIVAIVLVLGSVGAMVLVQ